MGSVAVAAAFVAATFVAARPAPANGCAADGRAAEALVAGLFDWIGAHTDYDTDAARANAPAIVLCVTGGTISYEGAPLLVEPGLRAMYSAIDHTVFLVAPWSAARHEDVSTLLHELVHGVQFRERAWPCPQAAEREAYALQAAWLAERGLPPALDPFTAYLLSRCPSDTRQ